MEIEIDFSQMPVDNPLNTALFFLMNGGWVIFIIVFIWGIIQFWLVRQRIRYFNKWEWTLLSIDIPKINEQYPKAVEHIFAALNGTWKHIDWIERFFTGKVQVNFSFELVSRGGYLEFLIRTPKHYRDLAEAAIYAQYPDAEISEVPDYADRFKGVRWPDNDQGWEIWGTEFKQIKKYYYPIKTWQQFFDVDKEKGFRDPVYAVLENLAKLEQGEEFWFQLVVTPANNLWKDRGNDFAKRKMGLQSSGSGAGSSVWDSIRNAIWEVADTVIYALVSQPESDESPKSSGSELIKKEQAAIEGIQEKISKIGFRTKMRVVYIARKEVFNKNKVKEGFLGALGQYTDLYSNGFLQDKYSKVSTSHLYYFRKFRVNRYRKNHILYNYHIRNTRDGAQFGRGFILNIEELASLWHFPVGDMKTLLIKKSEFKKAEAPFALPVEDHTQGISTVGTKVKTDILIEPEEVNIEEDYDPPDNLPVG